MCTLFSLLRKLRLLLILSCWKKNVITIMGLTILIRTTDILEDLLSMMKILEGDKVTGINFKVPRAAITVNALSSFRSSLPCRSCMTAFS
mmetsp:Transcript_44520/g.93138  ORF Transcript_44520/g.93138 Transcript_44520/m.93138 type:complete len:90 (+) Transcript_44520:784-1053(+)